MSCAFKACIELNNGTTLPSISNLKTYNAFIFPHSVAKELPFF
jgi:hypothetical protein